MVLLLLFYTSELQTFGGGVAAPEVVPYSVDSQYVDSDCQPGKPFEAEKYPPQTLIAPRPRPLRRPQALFRWFPQ